MAAPVTVGIPIYKRLSFLPNVLKSVSQQDYSNLELIVSDNGMNGGQVSAIVKEYYPRSFKIRQNATVETMSTHFNQIINAASGKYFMLLCDDDEISPITFQSSSLCWSRILRHQSRYRGRRLSMNLGSRLDSRVIIFRFCSAVRI